MAYWRKYMEAMLEAQAAIIRDQADAIEEAGRVITESVRRGGVLHMFGSGHSHLAAEEGFYRSGGLAPVSPMLDPSLMFHEGTEKCIALEKWDGYATRFVVPRFELRPEDTLMVFSASGRNNAPIEVAMAGRKRGLYTIGVTSRRYSDAFPSRHPSGKHLADVVDLVLDHDAPPGDGLLQIDEMPELGTTGAASTALAVILVHAVFSAVIDNFVQAGETPPMIRCPNVGSEQEALQANAKTLAAYRSRLPFI
ncbi:MAG: SIS domain-containing protein [Chloroflexi bacterium]|nr:MAG: SIS domain-containing protein [Chloroflexota bacterium]